MSRSIKLIIAGLCIALASASTASAQVSQMRLFSPFPDDQFGGGVYGHEGLYGSIGAGIVSISQPSDQVVGSKVGGTQYVTNVIPNTTSNQTCTTFTYSEMSNQMATARFHADWETATEFVIGNTVTTPTGHEATAGVYFNSYGNASSAIMLSGVSSFTGSEAPFSSVGIVCSGTGAFTASASCRLSAAGSGEFHSPSASLVCAASAGFAAGAWTEAFATSIMVLETFGYSILPW